MVEQPKKMTDQELDERFAQTYQSRANINSLLKGLKFAVQHLRVIQYDQNKVRNQRTVNEVIDALFELSRLSKFLGQELDWPKVVSKGEGGGGGVTKVFPPNVED